MMKILWRTQLGVLTHRLMLAMIYNDYCIYRSLLISSSIYRVVWF